MKPRIKRVILRARARERTTKNWWPRDLRGRLCWVYVDGYGFSTILDKKSQRIRYDDAAYVKELFEEENGECDWKVEAV
jgi:hypothetical protein